jgi:hypothetical protein
MAIETSARNIGGLPPQPKGVTKHTKGLFCRTWFHRDRSSSFKGIDELCSSKLHGVTTQKPIIVTVIDVRISLRHDFRVRAHAHLTCINKVMDMLHLVQCQ